MNTNNRTWILVIAVCAALAACAALVVLTGCPQPSGGSGGGSGTQPQTVVCPCNPKEHYLPCTCAAKGTANCTCVVKPRGEVTEDGTGEKIPVYQTAGVSDSAVVTDVTNVITGYADMSSSNKASMQRKIKEIRIVTTGDKCTAVDGGKYIIELNSGKSSNSIKDKLSWFVVNGDISQIQSSAREIVRMALHHTRQTIRS